MFGLLITYEDGNVALTITPHTFDPHQLLVTITIDGLQLPSMPIPLAGLRELLEVMVHAKKAGS